MYGDRHYARFYALETIARVPYFAYTSVLHLYEVRLLLESRLLSLLRLIIILDYWIQLIGSNPQRATPTTPPCHNYHRRSDGGAART